jgi:hypothetical protein
MRRGEGASVSDDRLIDRHHDPTWRQLRRGLVEQGLKIDVGVDRLERRLAWQLDCHEPLLSSG